MFIPEYNLEPYDEISVPINKTGNFLGISLIEQIIDHTTGKTGIYVGSILDG